MNRSGLPQLLTGLAFLAITWGISLPLAHGQDLLNDTIRFSGVTLQLRPYVVVPAETRNIISMTTRPGDDRLYVTTQEGVIYAIGEDASGRTTPTPWFDARQAIESATGRRLDVGTRQSGLQAVAFHPDFTHYDLPGYGKFYTSFLEQRPANAADAVYLGQRFEDSTAASDSVLAEWTFDHSRGEVVAHSYRLVFRVWLPVYDHPIKQLQFNPYALPGNEDYGLLYVAHGDSSLLSSPDDHPQSLKNALGKILRIDPLVSGEEPYTIPATNPFAQSAEAEVLGEIYAYGFRNPHTFSFNADDAGQVHLLAGDIGRNNIEEINRVLPGGNYGWPKREGTFVYLQQPDDHPEAGYITGVAPLPANDAAFGYIYPVAQFDHNAEIGQIRSGNAVASGFVIRNGSDPRLHNQFIFANFADHDGNVYHADFEAMLAAVIRSEATAVAPEVPAVLTQATIHRLRLSLDHDNNPSTPPESYDDFLELLDEIRSDIRFGQGVAGEMYISSKRNGTIYLVTNSCRRFALPCRWKAG